MMSKHTSGPWDAVDQGHVWKNLQLIAVAHPGRDAEANARLIAAAPDLLEVLKELEECAGYWSEYDVPLGIVDRIRAAIAKAEAV